MRTIIGNKTFYNRQNGAIGGHTSPGYLMKWGQTLFGFFTTRKEMEEWYLTVKVDCFSKGEPFVPLEVIYDAQRCGFFADIECLAPLDMDADDVETLKSDIMVGVNEAYKSRGLSSDALVWSKNHRKQAEKGVLKISFHVVGRDVDFIGTDKNSDLGHVAKKMNRECRTVAEKYPHVSFSTCGKTRKNINVLDLTVYSRNRAMRTIYSSKEGAESSCFLPCAGFEDVPLSSWWIVRDVDSQGVVHEEPWTDDDEKALSNVLGKALTAHTYDGPAFQSFIASTSKTPSTADQRKLAERLQTHFRDLQQDSTITVNFYALYSKDGFSPKDAYRIDGTSRNCHPCGRTHTSNGGGILDLGSDRFLYRCFAGERAVAFSLGGESENVGGDVIPVTLVEPDDGRVPSILGRSEKVIHITAGMGSGKTYRVEEYIRENPEKTVLYATCRISMATTIAGRMEHLGFKSYRDVPGTSINSCKRLVCEIESFHRLHRKYDVVVIDEARAVMSAVTSYETNGENLLINYDNLLYLSRECGKLVVMCADSNLDRAVDIFVENVFRVDGGQKLIIDDAFMQLGEGVGQQSFATMFKKLQHQRDESIHRIEVKKPILQRKFIQAPHDTAMAMMVRDVMEGQKVVVCVGSKKYMEATEENLKRKVTDRELKIRTYLQIPLTSRSWQTSTRTGKSLMWSCTPRPSPSR